ncbi:MAG TPA: hypothetical protein VG167_03005, partial [Verrucomicrobiae bacterium]|nr:hypothetical protein [Verrucomicrobiae bacterium]
IPVIAARLATDSFKPQIFGLRQPSGAFETPAPPESARGLAQSKTSRPGGASSWKEKAQVRGWQSKIENRKSKIHQDSK